MKIKKKVCRYYIDGMRMAGDVLKMALKEYISLDDMKKVIIARNEGHDVEFKVERE